MNILYMPSGSKFWLNTINELTKAGFSPAIWLGDPTHDEYAKQNFPNCQVYSFYEVHKIIKFKNDYAAIDSKVLSSKEFFILKDQVYKIMDRQDDLGLYNRLDREAFFYYSFYYFYNEIVKNNIAVVISAEGPHSPITMLLYGICKILNIPSYHLAQNSIIPVVHIAKDFYGDKLKLKNLNNSYNKDLAAKLVKNYMDSIDGTIPTPLYMKNQFESNRLDLKNDIINYIAKPIARRLYHLLKKPKKLKNMNYSVYRSDFSKSDQPKLFHDFNVVRKKIKLKSEYKDTSTHVSLDQPYIYIPLHYEPERTSNPDGGHFYNTYDMLISLRNFVPIDIRLIIKEHPSQFVKTMHGHRGRSKLFYKAIKAMPNVEFADIETPSEQLIKNSLFIATQTGSASLEAALLGKKSLIFGSPWFLGAPNTYSYGSLSFDDLIHKSPSSKKEVEDFILSYIDKYTIPACVNPSGYGYFSNKYPEHIDTILNDQKFAEDFSLIIANDLKNK